MLYREVQRFRQLLLWLFLAAVFALNAYAVVQQLMLGEPFGNNPASDTVLIIIAVAVGLGFPVFFFTMNLTTEVRTDGLYYRFFPFHFSFRRIAPEDLTKYELRTYSPLREYGGWGIRYGTRGKAYNVGGNRGVQLEFSDGKRMLIGSRRPEQLVEAMNMAFQKGQR